MKGVAPLFLGIFGTFAISWAGLVAIPNAQIGHLEPQMDEEGTDIYPAPESGLTERGRQVYAANGCVYCHTQQVRAEYAGADIDRGWGSRRSAPRDYIFERTAMLGRMRMGPDLANVGKRAPVDDETAPPPSATEGSTGAQPPPAPAAGTTAPGTPTAPEQPAAGGAPAAPAAAPAGQAPPAAPAPPAAGQAQPAAAPAPPAGQAAPAAGQAPPAAPSAPGAGQASPAPVTNAPTADVAAAPTSPGVTGEGGQNEPLQYSAAWHHRHLYDPRSITYDSTMPSYRFLYEKRRVSGERSADALRLSGPGVPPEGWEIVPTYDAKALVAYLMSLDQTHGLKEVKTPAAAAPAAIGAPGGAAK